MKLKGTSRLKGFYRMGVDERREILVKRNGKDAQEILKGQTPFELIDQMIENAVGVLGLPLGIATNFKINNHELLIPMAIEEPSVIAAASNAARMVREGSGFMAEADPPHMIAQVEILDPTPGASERIKKETSKILSLANSTQTKLVSLGGGARKIIIREGIGDKDRLVVHLVVDCMDAMGANMVNTMAEAISELLAELSGGEVGLRILTNLADHRLARARCEVPFDALARHDFSGEEVACGVEAASDFAASDPYRAATHNKGIFNGIDAVLIATGNDWRAVEAGGHAYAARKGCYGPLATWHIKGDLLVGEIAMPMAVGIVSGAAQLHPTAGLCIDLLGTETASELACVVVSAGLACNLAALAALSSEGIQQGHMRLHQRKFKKKNK
ncbi:MAG: hydroxymethylglutaryl-CoA reductase, degradative [Proteobacteria bacterium]|nr:hydroxymethylglutaryl-CoA reductase, degradative [Pseudomonadota bacterium]